MGGWCQGYNAQYGPKHAFENESTMTRYCSDYGITAGHISITFPEAVNIGTMIMSVSYYKDGPHTIRWKVSNDNITWEVIYEENNIVWSNNVPHTISFGPEEVDECTDGTHDCGLNSTCI
eukprot:UN32219